MNASQIKNNIKEILPKEYAVYVSKHGLNVQIAVKVNAIGGWDNANRLVHSMEKEMKRLGVKLEEIASRTDLTTNVCDWEFNVCNNEDNMLFEAKQVLKAMKKFFNKYGNAYCSSTKTYEVIEQMRTLVATDEN